MDALYNGNSISLLTDMYQLTMAQGYWECGKHNQRCVFQLYFRKPPFKGSYAVAAGLQTALEYLRRWGFDASDVAYLRTLRDANGEALFSEDFLAYLAGLRGDGVTISAVAEGDLVFPDEPVLRVEGPLVVCQLLETPLLTIVGFQTLVATKTTRVVRSATRGTVMDFGLRRAHGPDGGVSMSRAAYIGGCDGTSNVLAGKALGIPVKGTHSHAWVMSFDTEMESFEQFAQHAPGNTVLLVDTYDTPRGIDRAIEVGKKMRAAGRTLLGVRLDSGDLAQLSIDARAALDAAGLTETKIVASDDLDEYRITELLARGAVIDLWGVGTRISTCYDQPALGCVYKLTAIEEGSGWRYVMKTAGANPEKASIPGKLQVRRYQGSDGKLVKDVLYDEELGLAEPGGEEVLSVVWRDGKLVGPQPTIDAIRDRARVSVGRLSDEHLAFEAARFPVELEARLADRRAAVRDSLMKE